MLAGETFVNVGFDAAALKPAECDVTVATDLPVDAVTIDYEGDEHVPDPEVLAELAESIDVRVTAPVRAEGFDPLGDDHRYDALPDAVELVLVAGHPAYLDEDELSRAIAPRLGAAVERSADPWIGTEGVERLALATGATQFELLSPTTERDFRGLRAAGFDGELAVYAPTVLGEEPDAILDAVGGYVSRRVGVRERLPDGAWTDSRATGRAREVLLTAAREYAVVGGTEAVGDRIGALKAAGADHVVAYPARGVSAFLEGA